MTRPLLVSFLLILPVWAKKPSVLLICVDDLRPEIKALGADYIHSPAMDSLVRSGRAFTNHYVQCPTCGASRYSLLTGRYAATARQKTNDAFFCPEARKPGLPPSLPAHFRNHGYQSVSIGKISHHPGGLGGKDWSDPAQIEMPAAWDASVMPTDPWKTPQAGMHGYAGGVPRGKYRPVTEHKEGDDFTYTDGWIAREALRHMDDLAAAGKPFFLAVGIMKPHLPFACPKSYLDLYQNAHIPPVSHPDKPQGLSTWHPSNEFFSYQHRPDNPQITDLRNSAAYAKRMRTSYAACVSYADAQIGKILTRLKERGLESNTIVVLWGDHGYHLGEHAIWGKHSLYERALRSPLIIRHPGMRQAGAQTKAIVETADVFPTVCELAGLPTPSGLSGRSLGPELADPNLSGGQAFGYWKDMHTIRTTRYRLTRHPAKDGSSEYELYDHHSPDGETKNLASTLPEVVDNLASLLNASIARASPPRP